MESEEPIVTKTWQDKAKKIFRQNLIVILTLVGCGVGFLVGFLVAPEDPSPSAVTWMGMPGELYIRMLKAVILPLIVSSVISGTASIEPRSNGKISFVCLVWILVTNIILSIVGAVLCLIVKPGESLESGLDIKKTERDVMETEDIFADLLRHIVPDNLVGACFQKALTKYEYKKVNVTIGNTTEVIREISRKYVGTAGSPNILGLIIASAIFGVGTSAMKEKGKPFLDFFKAAMEIILKIMRVLIWTTPVGVASLMAKSIATTENLEEEFRKLGIYTATVIGSQAVWVFVVIPIIYLVIRRQNPYKFLLAIIHPTMIVFATVSAMVALPESFRSLEEKAGIDVRVSRFVAPISATIGRCGSALFISASCIFIIQLIDFDLNAANTILIVILTAVSTLAIPSIPSASLITILIILTSLNIEGEAITILFTVEFLTDRARSCTNLITQLTGVAITETLCMSSLRKSLTDEEDTEVDVVEKKPLDNNEISVRF